MKHTILLLIITFTLTYACNKITCAAYIGACGGLCTCDLPICECCAQCVGCLGAMWSECCDCFGHCNSLTQSTNHTVQVITNFGMVKQTTNFIPLRTVTACDGSANHAVCFRCIRYSSPVTMNYCECHDEPCRELSRADICCPTGQSAVCYCNIDGMAICHC